MKATHPMANNLETPGLTLRPYQSKTTKLRDFTMNNEVTPAQNNEVTSLVDRMAQLSRAQLQLLFVDCR